MEQMKCPACGGSILPDAEREVLFCPYCGTKMPAKSDALDKILKHDQQKQHFNEEVRQRQVQEKIDAEKRNDKNKAKALIIAILAIAAIGLVFFFGIRGENNSEAELNALVLEIQADLEAGNYDLALFKTERLYWPHSDLNGQKRWNQQRESLEKVIREAQKKNEKGH